MVSSQKAHSSWSNDFFLEHYNDVSSPNFDLIHQSLTSLAADRDHDVRQAAALKGRVEASPPALPPVQQLPEPSPETDLDLVEDQEEIINPTWAQIVETTPTTTREDLETEEWSEQIREFQLVWLVSVDILKLSIVDERREFGFWVKFCVYDGQLESVTVISKIYFI